MVKHYIDDYSDMYLGDMYKYDEQQWSINVMGGKHYSNGLMHWEVLRW